MKTRNTTHMEHEWMLKGLNRSHARQQAAGGLSAALRMAVLGAVAMGLGACASPGEGGFGSSVFLDPAKYELYNCQQLLTARKSTNDRIVELEGLMAKAETGAGGALISGLAYQTDYRTQRAQRDDLDARIARDNCSAELAKPAAPAAPPKRKR
ncbi:MAG: hypothetical protein G4V63_16610 [Candidatus Afipia apatlaquensis]|uniref:Twin-arginine translocation pathway signal n=1 Tax=Candidatus Afipia apatlaquensis TaxID=2712852 RepID=A0A7C9VIH6_9BRAD|nr:hypothetical protein [Candidatus Afipia apatlaquensis]